MPEQPNGRTKITRFEELIAWQQSRTLTRDIYKVTKSGPMSKDFGFRDQIQRAAVSIMSNIAEGFERYSRKEFHHFLAIARGSCAEVRSLLYVASDAGYIGEAEFSQLMSRAVELTRIITGLKTSVSGLRIKS